MKTAIIHQPHGLGDLIFCQGIAQYIKQARGYERIIWPVVSQYISDVRRAYPDIRWTDEGMSDFPFKTELLDALCVPIRWSDTIMKVPYHKVMRAKYDMYGLDWTYWKNHAMWQRDKKKEQELFEMMVKPYIKYNLISTSFTGNFKNHHFELPNNGLWNIFINPINGYSLFDWAKLIENATEIHFVASSNIYMLEMLKLKAEKICIYKRVPDQPSHKYYDYILQSHNYKLI